MKRIVVCCDGTWMDSDGAVQVPSNVTRIARGIKPTAHLADGTEIAQVIIYQSGIGTGTNSWYDKYIGGATGLGMADHIREGYAAICLNYTPGDEIFIVGFSRGAFTARSISGLIRAIGLLTPKGLQYFIPIFEDWEYQLKDGWKTSYAEKPWPGHKPPVTEAEYQRQLLHLELTRPNIPIKAVAVWDTVGSLGIPMIGLLPQPPSRDFAFVDTKVEPNIEYAFQALSLDEHRRPYSPTIWEKPEGQEFPRVLKQTWFPGTHADIGGAYEDTDLANITLCWMVNQLDKLLEFDEEYILRQIREGIEHDEKQRKRLKEKYPNRTIPPLRSREWALGKIHDSMTSFYKLSGSRIRTPKEYTNPTLEPEHGQMFYFLDRIFLSWWTEPLGLRIGRLDPKQRGRRRQRGVHHARHAPFLQGTNETVHASVRVRMGQKGLGYDDKGSYDSQALKGWTMHGECTDPNTPIRQEIHGEVGRMKNVEWRKTVRVAKPTQGKPANVLKVDYDSNKGWGVDDNEICGDEEEEEEEEIVLVMPEDQMGEFEKEIVSLWPRIAQRLDSTLPGSHEAELVQVLQHASTAPDLDGAATTTVTGTGAGTSASAPTSAVAPAPALASTSTHPTTTTAATAATAADGDHHGHHGHGHATAAAIAKADPVALAQAQARDRKNSGAPTAAAATTATEGTATATTTATTTMERTGTGTANGTTCTTTSIVNHNGATDARAHVNGSLEGL